MKSIVEENVEVQFPTLMALESTGEVVLFISKTCGTIVNSTNPGSIGYSSNSWTIRDFKPYYGKIHLEQNKGSKISYSKEVFRDEKPFPKLMWVPHDILVYFSKPNEGIVIGIGDRGDRRDWGRFSNNWVMSKFEDHIGVSILETKSFLENSFFKTESGDIVLQISVGDFKGRYFTLISNSRNEGKILDESTEVNQFNGKIILEND